MRSLARLLRSKEAFVFLLFSGIVAAVTIICAVRGSAPFLNKLNLQQMARDTSFLGILAMGETFVIIAAGIDLSVGSMVSFSCVALAWMYAAGVPLWAGSLVVLAMAAVIGLYHGFLVARVRVSAFIVTLGTMGIAMGVARVITNEVPISGIPAGFKWLANGLVWGVPVPFFLLLGILAVAAFFAHFTVYGRYLYSLGGNREATRLSGVNVRWVETSAYVAGTILAALTGLLYAALTGQGDPKSGELLELEAITAAVVGGCSLSGGVGSVLGAVLGAATIVALQKGLLFLGVPTTAHKIVIGGVLVVAVAIDTWRQERRR
ncbi:ABC transporter permease [bacterium]|nr:ABC transporter permease [bacterium]